MTAESRSAGTGALTASVLLGPATIITLVVMVAPLMLLFRYSLNTYDPMLLMVEALTLQNYLNFFIDPFYREVLFVTVTVAGTSTLLALILGMPIAYRLARTQSRWKSLAILLVIMPLFIGGTVRTVGWMILFGRGGVLDSVASIAQEDVHFELMYTQTAVITGLVSIILPFMVLTLQSVFESIDIRLEEAASGLGASPGHTYWRIVWPLALPGVVTGSILTFILSMNAYATPVLLGGPRFEMMAPLLYYEFSSNNNWPFAAALAFILMTVTFTLTALVTFFVPKKYQ